MPDVPSNGWQALVLVLPSVLAFLTSALAAVLAFMAKQAGTATATKVDEVHVILNSRLDALVLATRAEGVVQGTADERKRVADLPGIPPSAYVPDSA